MCRECDAATAREQAATDLLAKCRAMSPLGEALRAVFPIERTPGRLTALALQLDRVMLP